MELSRSEVSQYVVHMARQAEVCTSRYVCIYFVAYSFQGLLKSRATLVEPTRHLVPRRSWIGVA